MQLATRIFVACVMAALIAFAVVVVYWELIDTAPPLAQKSVETLDAHGNPATAFRPGDTMSIRRDACVMDEGEAVFTRTLVRTDGKEVYFVESGPQYLTPGCRVSYNAVRIPVYASYGDYDYVVRISFHNNPLTTSQQTMLVPQIKIVK